MSVTSLRIAKRRAGAIPKYNLETDLDIVDTVINDLKLYTKSLIYEDKALANQIETYLRKREISEEQKKDRQDAFDQGLDAPVLSDEDYQEHYEQMDELRRADAELYATPIDEEEK